MTAAILRLARAAACAALVAASPAALSGQVPTAAASDQPPDHDHDAMIAGGGGWQFNWDAGLFATFNHQSGPRGDREFRSQNWLMLMGSRPVGSGTFSVSGMWSLEPLTATERGYAQLFQLGEAYDGLPVVDRQHPHDLFMQLHAAWRQPIGPVALLISGGPISSPALGPPVFMHRASASENPTAPLTHHTFDSTHITGGVVTAGLEMGAFRLEASAFHGREPDEHRYDLEIGPLDSGSARLTWAPSPAWEFQVSRGHLREPEQLEPGDQKRTNGSATWRHTRASGALSAVTIAAGRVSRTYSWTGSLLVEGLHWMGQQAVYGRYEGLGTETEHLLFPQIVHLPHPGELVDPIHAFTAGGVRRLLSRGGFDLAVGGDVTFYRVPPLLAETHRARPVSAHVFFRLRPIGGAGHDMHGMH